jgi:hypothetical protein
MEKSSPKKGIFDVLKKATTGVAGLIPKSRRNKGGVKDWKSRVFGGLLAGPAGFIGPSFLPNIASSNNSAASQKLMAFNKDNASGLGGGGNWGSLEEAGAAFSKNKKNKKRK